MRTVLLALGLLATTALQSHASILIRVNQSTQRMSVDVDGQHLYDWRVSTGRPGFDTPNGEFRPNRMDADHTSKEYDNAPMPHAIFFDLHGHAIHGSFDPIGHPAASHGCVRLDPTNAATLFDLVNEQGMGNTKVEISGDVRVALLNSKATRKVVAARRPPPRIVRDDEIDPGYASPYPPQAYETYPVNRAPSPYGGGYGSYGNQGGSGGFFGW